MRNRIVIPLAVFMLCSFSHTAYTQKLTNYAKQLNQELADRKLKEKANYEKACNEGTLTAYNEYLSMYPKGKYVQDVKNRIAVIERKAEQDCYDDACLKETVNAYQNYISKYPNGRYAQEARGRIEDMELWHKAKSANTIDAYRSYIINSKNKSFEQLANDAISELESKESWNHLRHSSSKSAIESFINKFPKSSCISEANRRYNELIAIEFFDQGDYVQAFDKFEAAGGRYLLEQSNRPKYDKCVEYLDFRKINSSSKVNEMLDFLNKYSSSIYRDQVSNMVAVKKAQSFSMYASSYDFNDALSYAKDNATRNTVQKYIADTKRSYKQYMRRQRHNRVMNNGGYVKFGLEILDMGINGLYSDDDESLILLYLNLGLSVKFGNYKSPVQLEFGVKPGVVVVKYYEEDDYYDSYYDQHYSLKNEDNKAYFHMPVYTKLKLNICSSGSSKLYIAGLGTYNAIRNKDYENEFSIGGGAGFAWKKWDWFVLYYKQDLNNKLLLDNQYMRFLGTSFVYYF